MFTRDDVVALVRAASFAWECLVEDPSDESQEACKRLEEASEPFSRLLREEDDDAS